MTTLIGHRFFPALWAAVTIGGLCAAPSSAAEVWSGLEYTFTKDNWADWTLPENQDRITDNVWMTRQDFEGIYNIAQEESYEFKLSPADTEWAYGFAEDYEELNFEVWFVWHDANPLNTLNQNAVMHLITDDIYVDIMFLDWTVGQGEGGGGFTYIRAIPEPCSVALLGLAVVAVVPRRRRH